MSSTTWFDVLEAARALSKGGKNAFTAADLAKAAELKDTLPSPIAEGPRAGQMGKGSTGPAIAAAWLGKFRKWGYAEVEGKVQTGAPRPTYSWKLTPLGLEVEPRDGLSSRLRALTQAAKTLLAARGRASEAQAWKDLAKVVDEVGAAEKGGK